MKAVVIFVCGVLLLSACGRNEVGVNPNQPGAPIVGVPGGVSGGWAAAMPTLLSLCAQFYQQSYYYPQANAVATCTCYYQMGQAAYPDFNAWRAGGEVQFFNATNAFQNPVYQTCIAPNIPHR
jgi:hypothetical protein